MKKISLITLLATALMSNSLAAEAAYPWGKVVNKRQKIERNRIKAGIGSGQLTKAEVNRLRKQGKYIAGKEALFKASGCGLNKREIAKLDNMQDRFGRHIYKQKHDSHLTSKIGN